LALTKESVIAALKTIIGPNGNDIVTGGEVRALSVDGNNVSFVLEIDQSLSKEYSKIKEASEVSVKKLGAKEVSIVLTAHTSQKSAS
jgi:ATP-binding protein involved in chromosome partitioning